MGVHLCEANVRLSLMLEGYCEVFVHIDTKSGRFVVSSSIHALHLSGDKLFLFQLPL